MDISHEGDNCPECGDGKIMAFSWKPFRMKCDGCGAEYNDRGERVPCNSATAGY